MFSFFFLMYLAYGAFQQLSPFTVVMTILYEQYSSEDSVNTTPLLLQPMR